jgi:hypothetical protein
MSQWNLGGLVAGSVLGFIAAWIVMHVLRPRGVEHPLYLPMGGAAIMSGLLFSYLYMTFNVDAVVAAFSRRGIEDLSQLFWFSAVIAYTIACGIAVVGSGIVGIVRIVRSRRE